MSLLQSLRKVVHRKVDLSVVAANCEPSVEHYDFVQIDNNHELLSTACLFGKELLALRASRAEILGLWEAPSYRKPERAEGFSARRNRHANKASDSFEF
jgi:hypothetical protein